MNNLQLCSEKAHSKCHNMQLALKKTNITAFACIPSNFLNTPVENDVGY